LKLWYVSGVQDLSKERGTFVVFSQLDLNEEMLRKVSPWTTTPRLSPNLGRRDFPRRQISS